MSKDNEKAAPPNQGDSIILEVRASPAGRKKHTRRNNRAPPSAGGDRPELRAEPGGGHGVRQARRGARRRAPRTGPTRVEEVARRRGLSREIVSRHDAPQRPPRGPTYLWSRSARRCPAKRRGSRAAAGARPPWVLSRCPRAAARCGRAGPNSPSAAPRARPARARLSRAPRWPQRGPRDGAACQARAVCVFFNLHVLSTGNLKRATSCQA